ncbi:MAG: prolyl oligopeptidase family serine peptidase [Sphingobium sp.]
MADPVHYPPTMREDVVETQFGVPVADPYRWLENDVRADARVADWVSAQNKTTQDYLATLPGRDLLARRMTLIQNHARMGVPRKAGGRYFYIRNSGLQNQSPLYVRDGSDGPERLLIDPNALAGDGATALAEWEASSDGKRLLYAVQDGGTDWRILRVIDVDSGRTLDDRVEWVKFSGLSWGKDGKGFYYSRFAPPPGGNKFQATVENQRVFYHALGTPQVDDKPVFATPRQPKLNHSAEVTDDGRWLLVTSSAGTDERYSLSLVPLAGQAAKPVPLIKRAKNDWAFVGSIGDALYFRTDMRAPRGRIVRLNAAAPRAAPVEIVPQDEDILSGASLIGGRIVLAYLSDARTVARLVERDGRPVGPVPLPDIGTAIGFSRKATDSETFFSFAGYSHPDVIYRYDTATNRASIWSRPNLAFDPEAFVTEQIFYPSKDGTQVPMFLIRRRDVAAAARPVPTIVYGYGGFNLSQTPGFLASRLAWLEQGGAFAVANLRGGGEYGKAWHDAGRLANKQNVFDDLIAAGEYLIAHGITGKGQLAVQGRSNGGLLVGAVVNQRPDLFAAALPTVGVMDMLRFDRFTAGRYWVDDYGYPSREADFRNLLSYSPYHNIRDGIAYPAILATTGDTDDRVVPGHSFKYVAALQHADIGHKPHLIRVDTRAGHGSGKPVDKQIAEFADMYAFAAYWTGLSIRDPAK